MKIYRPAASRVAAAALAFAALGVTQTAQARDVYWSIGLSSPGVQLGVGNGPPAVVYQQPYAVYTEQYPVYRERRPVYRDSGPVIYVQPPPVVIYRDAPLRYIRSDWERPGRGWGPRHHPGRDDDPRFESRYDRYDRYDRSGWHRSGHGEREHRRH